MPSPQNYHFQKIAAMRIFQMRDGFECYIYNFFIVHITLFCLVINLLIEVSAVQTSLEPIELGGI